VGNAKEAARPMGIPGSVMISGMIWCSRSIKVMTMSDEINTKYTKLSRDRPNLNKRATATIPFISSTRGYRKDIRASQLRHLPLSQI
jgi:hypothetical protein